MCGMMPSRILPIDNLGVLPIWSPRPSLQACSCCVWFLLWCLLCFLMTSVLISPVVSLCSAYMYGLTLGLGLLTVLSLAHVTQVSPLLYIWFYPSPTSPSLLTVLCCCPGTLWTLRLPPTWGTVALYLLWECSHPPWHTYPLADATGIGPSMLIWTCSIYLHACPCPPCEVGVPISPGHTQCMHQDWESSR